MRSVLGGALYPEALGARRGAPAPKGHTVVDRHVRAAVPGRAAGARARRRPRAVHAARGRATASSRARSTARSCGARARRRRCARSPSASGSTSTRASPTATAPRTSQFLETVGRPTRAQPDQGPATRSPTSAAGRAARFTRARAARARRRSAAPRRPTAASPPGCTPASGIGLLKRSRKARHEHDDVARLRRRPRAGRDQARRRRAPSTCGRSRPAVFIFNHQSWLDGMIVMKLLREDVTAVAKKEVARQPIMGQIGWLLNMAFVDRGNTARRRRRRSRRSSTDPRGLLAGDLARGHALADAARRAVQEGRVPHGDAGRRADRADRDPQRRPACCGAARCSCAAARSRSQVLPPISVDDWTRERPRRARRGRAPAVRGHARRLAENGRRRMTRPIQVTVLGAGSWGTTVASLAGRQRPHRAVGALAGDGGRRSRDEHRNSRYLPRPGPRTPTCARRRRSPEAVADADVLSSACRRTGCARHCSRRPRPTSARGSRS